MSLRELNSRNSDGINVLLLWDEDTGNTFIEIEDSREDSCETFPVSPEDAADAFQHPFAYLARCNSTRNHPGYSVKV